MCYVLYNVFIGFELVLQQGVIINLLFIFIVNDEPGTTMTPEELKEFIELESSVVSAGVALLTFVGLPDCGKSKLAQEILQKEFKMTGSGKLMKINEKDTEFSVFELGAIRRQGVETWKWCQLAKRSRYLSCFVSALKSDTVKQRIKSFANQGCMDKDFFKDKELNKCFYNLYRLLHDFYDNESAKPETTDDGDKLELKEDDTLTLINVWDIGFNRAFLHFYPLLCGHLHHNYPILFLGCPNDLSTDGDHLEKTFNIDKCGGMLAGMEPILGQYSRVKYLLSFSHMARSYDRRREQVSQVVAIVHSPDTVHQHDSGEIINARLQEKIKTKVEEFSVEGLLNKTPWVLEQKITEQEVDYQDLKKKVNSLVESEKQKDIPLSWYFLRSAFYKTGQLFIKTADLRECAHKCKIADAGFEEFLKKFTGFGSIIHIPDFPGLCDLVILNPPDFFHKLNELYYPRFNGDLQYGIASFSTLKRLFGEENFSFFIVVLTAINLAVKIDSDRVVKDDKEMQRRLLIEEECLYIPSIRTVHVAKPDLSSSACSSTGQSFLRIIYKKMHLPTHTSEDIIKFLLQNDPHFHLLTCEWYNVTRFQYYHLEPKATALALVPEKHQVVTLTMISHKDKNEMLIKENEEANTITGIDIKEVITVIKKKVIKAYCNAEEMYSRHHYKLLGVEPELELELHSLTNINPNEYHWHSINTDIHTCESCKQDKALKTMWMYGKEHWKAR